MKWMFYIIVVYFTYVIINNILITINNYIEMKYATKDSEIKNLDNEIDKIIDENSNWDKKAFISLTDQVKLRYIS